MVHPPFSVQVLLFNILKKMGFDQSHPLDWHTCQTGAKSQVVAGHLVESFFSSCHTYGVQSIDLDHEKRDPLPVGPRNPED